jgi:ribonuclease BN (tRNA processing enzyme)
VDFCWSGGSHLTALRCQGMASIVRPSGVASMGMRLTVLGGGGAYPTPERGCSGYLIAHGDFLLLIDPGYATVPELLKNFSAADVDAVLITHSHADHCADLNPLLRVRHLSGHPPPALPVFALSGAADAVLALDGPMLSAGADYTRHDFNAGDAYAIGPFQVTTRSLQHFVPNVGVRLDVGGASLAYTGDGGADPQVVDLASGASLLLAEATFPEDVPEASVGHLSSARQAGDHATAAHVGELVLTHLWPGVQPDAAAEAARRTFDGPISVAMPGFATDIH